jgi:oligopeptide/dipeptide ABC transporter ATP-binding protein
VQAQYLNLLKSVQRESGMSMIFVTHDLGVVARMCDRVAVMYAGRVVETAPTRELFAQPRHPYTQALLRCLPRVDGPLCDLESIEGQPPNLGALPPGCRFAPRCRIAIDACSRYPDEDQIGVEHKVCCWRACKTQEATVSEFATEPVEAPRP